MSGPRYCPKCGEALPEAGGGFCPRCQHHLLTSDLELGEAAPVVRVESLPPPPRPLQPVLVSSEAGPLPPPAALPAHERDWMRCPRCSARVRRIDPHCFLCGYPLPADVEPADVRSPEPARRDYEPHRGPLIRLMARISLIAGGLSFTGIAFLPLAAVSVMAAAAGIGAYVMSRDDLELMDRQVMDSAGREATLAGQSHALIGIVLGIAGAILSLLVKMPSLLA